MGRFLVLRRRSDLHGARLGNGPVTGAHSSGVPETLPCLIACLLIALAAPVLSQDRIRVVNEGGIRDAWTLAPGTQLAAPPYPSNHAADPAEACVGIGYLLNPDGTTSDFALVRAWSAKAPSGANEDAYWQSFAKVSAAALSTWRFQPRPEAGKPEPVYTVATFLFAARDPQALRKRCAVANLAHRLAELRMDRSLRRRMAGGIFDQLEIDPAFEDIYRAEQHRQSGANRNMTPPVRPSSPPPPPPPPPPRP